MKGYTTAERYVVQLENDSSVFVKAATDEDTAQWLRNEHRIYGAIKADFLPKLLAWEDGERPLLILEDLSAGFWPPPWSQERIARVIDTLKKIAAAKPPSGTPPLETFFKNQLGWEQVAADPSGFLGLGITSPQWLAKALPVLIKAERDADFSGDALVHMDVRSDNICFLGDRTLLVDWNWASVGTPRLDLIAWLPSLYSEGGPAPWDMTLDEQELIAVAAGYWASHAYLPLPREGSTLRQLQLAQLKSALLWAARALRLPLPEPIF
ncbi:MAG: phosphotransferase [Candidatus Sungiibacteriota bacterium]